MIIYLIEYFQFGVSSSKVAQLNVSCCKVVVAVKKFPRTPNSSSNFLDIYLCAGNVSVSIFNLGRCDKRWIMLVKILVAAPV